MFYFGTLAIIGLSSPDNFYSSFVAAYLNFIAPLRYSLLRGASMLLAAFGYSSSLKDDYTILLNSGEGVRMVYSCIGYGVMSFWTAFVFANRGGWKKKAVWILIGLFALWIINVWRIALLLMTMKKRLAFPLGWDHHTWFNIAAYLLIFAMIYFYDRSFGKSNETLINTNANQNTQALQ